MVGLAGTEITGLERAWLKLVRPAGIILFRRNIVDAGQTRLLLGEAAPLCADHSLRCVDVEGGSVDRLRYALAPMPSAQAVGAAMRSSIFSHGTRKDGVPKSSSLAREQGDLIGQAVRAFGFNTTLAPVLDIALPASADVMGTRCAAATVEGVVEYGREFLAGLATHGVVGCGKHFPGLGGGTLDSHVDTPAIHRTMRELNREDIAPYAELRNELPMIMVNHAAYPDARSGDRPASVSAYWIANVLRKQLGYQGIIFSDDLEMGGILKFMPIEEAVIAAALAGMDLMEICHSPELILRAFEALISEAERSPAFRRLLEERARKTARKRRKLFGDKASKALSSGQFEALRKRIERFSEAVAESQTRDEVRSA